ncbi:MAG: helix-turn-helix domain-containing protein [Micrococcus sp.]|nr:helix-turn-helix domain-containing protein [Micrococcus sp.]
MRSDARANRHRILRAARTLMAARGTAAVPLTAIAALSGVGIGTLYRHFPTLDDLHIALLESVSETVQHVSERWHAPMLQDPMRAWPAYARELATLQLTAVLILLPVTRRVATQAAAQAAQQAEAAMFRAEQAGAKVLRLAQQAGLVRPNVEHAAFLMGLGAASRTLAVSHTGADEQPPHPWLKELTHWFVDIYLAGLRPEVDAPAPPQVRAPSGG